MDSFGNCAITDCGLTNCKWTGKPHVCVVNSSVIDKVCITNYFVVLVIMTLFIVGSNKLTKDMFQTYLD